MLTVPHREDTLNLPTTHTLSHAHTRSHTLTHTEAQIRAPPPSRELRTGQRVLPNGQSSNISSAFVWQRKRKTDRMSIKIISFWCLKPLYSVIQSLHKYLLSTRHRRGCGERASVRTELTYMGMFTRSGQNMCRTPAQLRAKRRGQNSEQKQM